MSEEVTPAPASGASAPAPSNPAPANPPSAEPPRADGGPKRKFYPKRFKKYPHPRGGAKVNNSPLRGANGSESVNPLLNAPLPTETRDRWPKR